MATASIKKHQLKFVSVILLTGFLVAYLLIVFRPEAERKAVEIKAPRVDVIVAEQKSQPIEIYSQGELEALTHISLASEVAGIVVKYGDAFKEGDFFKQGDLLLKIDERDYKLAVVRAQAQVAAAEQRLNRVQAEASQAREDLRRLSAQALENASPFARREPQLKEAEASLKAARADLLLAELKLSKTAIYAPFDGRLIKKQVGIGQYVTPGSGLAEIYQYSRMQVKLPVSLAQLNLLSLAIGDNGELQGSRPVVDIYADKEHWQGIVRQLDGEIDRDTQLINLLVDLIPVADKKIQSLLIPGLFVKAIITSSVQRAVFVLPRYALHYNNELWLLDENNRLQKTPVKIIYKNANNIYLDKGLKSGQKIIVSAIDAPVAGMALSLHDDVVVK